MKNKNNFLRGFTVIELIVVIAIIAVLSTIVSASVMTYLTKGKNAAIKGNLANLATYGGLYLTGGVNDDYSDFCADPAGKTQQFLTKIDEINGAETIICRQDTDHWCVMVGLVTSITTSKDKPVFCIDSTGVKVEGKEEDIDCEEVDGAHCEW